MREKWSIVEEMGKYFIDKVILSAFLINYYEKELEHEVA